MTVPADPRAGRQRHLSTYLRVATGLVLLAAIVGVGSPDDDVRIRAADVMVGLLIATPLVRVAWLSVRWWHKSDRRFALLATAVLLLVACGAYLGTR